MGYRITPFIWVQLCCKKKTNLDRFHYHSHKKKGESLW